MNDRLRITRLGDVRPRLKNEEFLRLCGAWYWETGIGLALERLSGNLEEIAGVAPGRWLGKALADLDSTGKVGAAFDSSRPFHDLLFVYQDDSGEERVASLVGEPRYGARGRLRGWCGTGRDITTTWKTEQRARQAEELLLGAMESISEGFALYDPDDRLLLFNQNYDFFHHRRVSPVTRGAKFSEIVRDAVTRGYYPAARGREEAWMRDRIRYHQNPRGLFEIELCDGRWLQIFERRTPSGGTVTINTDITAVKRRDEKQLQAQKLQALGELTGGVAHDISNVLLLLECNLDLAVKAMYSGGDPRSYLEGCETAMRLANGLNHRLLAVARQQPLQSSVVDVNELAQRMKDFLARTLPKSIVIETLLSPGVWRVLIDESQLETALLNLSLNARDAMPHGGALRIETGNVYLQENWTHQNGAHPEHDLRPGSYVVVIVSDTGSGMTREVARRAMEPFFTTKRGKGSGLGLSMTYGFIKQSGGDMEIASSPGNGTAVKLFLPKVDIGESRVPPADL